MKLILDSDIILYRACFRAQADIGELVDEIPDGMIREQILSATASWIKPLERYNPTELLFCQSDEAHKYFRHTIYPDYKNNRTGGERPQKIDYAREVITNASDLSGDLGIKCKSLHIRGLEADDILGIAGTSPKNKESIVVSTDKDIHTLPCRIFNPRKMRTPIVNTEATANRNIFLQATMGDNVDGYKGVVGIGKVKAERLFATARGVKQMWEIFLQAGKTAKERHSEEYLIKMVQLARILRFEDYDKEGRKVRLMSPNGESWISL